LAAVLALIPSLPALAAEPLFELTTRRAVTKGVTYEENRQVTDAGLLDIHVLTIPLDDPYITVGPAASANDAGLKETVTRLLADNGAVAGTNGDFFGLAGDHSSAFGPEVKDGKLLSLNTSFNKEENEFSGFFLDNTNNPFMTFIQTEIHFYNDGKENIAVSAINKVSDFVLPVIITPAAMSDTASVDARFGGLLKVVVSGQAISYVSRKGETVKVPADGYVLVIQEASADWFGPFFKAGQSAELKISTKGVDLSKIVAAIGGGGRILANGEIVSYGTIPAGRQPRTALGITRDKKRLILAEVDGRSYSIGATNDEMGRIMLRYGAYNAMHLDGGGSSTMVIKEPGAADYTVVNNLSDGVQRKVVNAFGVYDNAPAGQVSRIAVRPGSGRAFLGFPVILDVYGLDEYYHRIDLDPARLTLTSDDPAGVIENGAYTAGKSGTVTFTASYDGLTGTASLGAEALEELDCGVGEIRTMEGGRTALSFTGMGGSGEQTPITDGITYEISPSGLGHMEGNVFVADSGGLGSIKASAAGIPAYVAVYSGGVETPVCDFEGGKELGFAAYPDTVTGGASYDGARFKDGASAAKLDYGFKVYDSTQAAYLTFAEPVKFDGPLVALKLWAYGDGKGYWLRGRITDAGGTAFPIDFAKNVDWTGWKQVTAVLPEDASYPVTLDRIYIASLNNTSDAGGTLWFDALSAVAPISGGVVLPDAPKYSDVLRADLSGAPDFGQDVTVTAPTVWKAPDVETADGDARVQAPKDYDAVRAAVLASMRRDCPRGLYLGDTGFEYKYDGFGAYQWNTGYVMHRVSTTAVLQMTAAKGGLLASNPKQWAGFSKDVAAMDPDCVIVELDANPLENWDKEFELFHLALARYADAGKRVFVVSADGRDTSVTSRDGVRYINLGSLWNADGTRNADYRVLRFRIDGKNVKYDLQK
ncbi:MAG: phosphodiester glycosidase family protein, partial [Firmicutes bacterium]|nr:phosphodiester glycosidase family protein [Bacillota bacterium]